MGPRLRTAQASPSKVGTKAQPAASALPMAFYSLLRVTSNQAHGFQDPSSHISPRAQDRSKCPREWALQEPPPLPRRPHPPQRALLPEPLPGPPDYGRGLEQLIPLGQRGQVPTPASWGREAWAAVSSSFHPSPEYLQSTHFPPAVVSKGLALAGWPWLWPCALPMTRSEGPSAAPVQTLANPAGGSDSPPNFGSDFTFPQDHPLGKVRLRLGVRGSAPQSKPRPECHRP